MGPYVMKRSCGFTLVELLISMAILLILVSVVGPNVREIVVRNRIVGQVNELAGLIQVARATAINERINVVVCPTIDQVNCSDDWNDNKIAFIDADGNEIKGSNEDIVAGTQTTSSTDILTGPSSPIKFYSTGITASPATLLLCPNSGEDTFARSLTISLQGRVKLSQDNDNDNIHESPSGTPLSC